ncbi:MAG: NADPH-dependent F420 reductase [Candidatus Kariarchaeaceae archaeon]|jgi:predicted dinucleotide-binding enzyme
MNIAILGAGRVGKTLGNKWLDTGHTIYYGSRTPNPDENTINHQSAVDLSDVVVLTVPGNAVKEVVSSLNFNGKTIIDTTNSFNSGMVDYMKLVSDAKFVKAFNTIGFNIIANPDFNGVTADGFYCTDSENATEVVEKLLSDCGFNPQSVGNSIMAPDLEN